MTTLAIIEFVRDHAGLVTAFVGTLLTFIGLMLATHWSIVSNKLKALEDADGALTARVGTVEVTLAEYKEHIGAGDKMFKQLMDRVETHMTEEEDQVWGGMRDLGKQISSMHEDNLKAHAAIVERLVRVETKLPNGELARLTAMIERLVGKV